MSSCEEGSDIRESEIDKYASDASKGSADRTARSKANHRAFESFLENDHSDAHKASLSNSISPSKKPSVTSETFVWPWAGIAVVKPRNSREKETMRASDFWLKLFAKFEPSEVLVFWESETGSISAVVRFYSDWDGLTMASKFEESFECSNLNKKNWIEQRTHGVIYGWLAREDDLFRCNSVGKYLRKSGGLRTISDINQEAKNKKMALSNLTRMLEEKNKLHETYVAETMQLQRMIRETMKSISDESNIMNELPELKNKKPDICSVEVDKRERTEQKEVDASNSSLALRSIEQSSLRSIEEQKVEKQEALNKITFLEKKVDAQQMEIVKLKGEIELTKHTMNENTEELKQKQSELEDVEAHNQQLLVSHWRTNNELVEARKELIKGFPGVIDGDVNQIGIKRMAEINGKPFHDICRQKFSAEEADLKATELCSVWQSKVIDSNWYPFKVICTNGSPKEILNEMDEQLVALKRDWGDEVYCSVVRALNESVEFNPSGRYIVPEIWDFKEDRRATLKEVVIILLKKIKAFKDQKGRKRKSLPQ